MLNMTASLPKSTQFKCSTEYGGKSGLNLGQRALGAICEAQTSDQRLAGARAAHRVRTDAWRGPVLACGAGACYCARAEHRAEHRER